MSYRILREELSRYYWEPTEEKMKEIAEHYEWKVKTMPLIGMRFMFFRFGIAGMCDPRKRILWINDDIHQVFWHELGHALIIDWRKRYGILSLIPTFMVINEVSASLMGILLSRRWYSVKSGGESSIKNRMVVR